MGELNYILNPLRCFNFFFFFYYASIIIYIGRNENHTWLDRVTAQKKIHCESANSHMLLIEKAFKTGYPPTGRDKTTSYLVVLDKIREKERAKCRFRLCKF